MKRSERQGCGRRCLVLGCWGAGVQSRSVLLWGNSSVHVSHPGSKEESCWGASLFVGTQHLEGCKYTRSSPDSLLAQVRKDGGRLVPFYRCTSEKQQLSKNRAGMSETTIKPEWRRPRESEGTPLSLHPLLSPCCSQERPGLRSKHTVGTRPSLVHTGSLFGDGRGIRYPIPSIDSRALPDAAGSWSPGASEPGRPHLAQDTLKSHL